MAEKAAKPKVYPVGPVTIGDTTYTLSYPYSALVRFTDMVGCPANALAARLAPDRIMLSDLNALLWAGLQKSEKLTIQQVDDLLDDVDPTDMPPIFATVQDLVSAAFGQKKKGAGADATADPTTTAPTPPTDSATPGTGTT